MSDTNAGSRIMYVILSEPTDPMSIFTTDLGDGRIAACVFSQSHHALLFGKNAQGIDPTDMAPMDAKVLCEALEDRKRAGTTHVLLDPSAASGGPNAIAIDEFMTSIKV